MVLYGWRGGDGVHTSNPGNAKVLAEPLFPLVIESLDVRLS